MFAIYGALRLKPTTRVASIDALPPRYTQLVTYTLSILSVRLPKCKLPYLHFTYNTINYYLPYYYTSAYCIFINVAISNRRVAVDLRGYREHDRIARDYLTRYKGDGSRGDGGGDSRGEEDGREDGRDGSRGDSGGDSYIDNSIVAKGEEDNRPNFNEDQSGYNDNKISIG